MTYTQAFMKNFLGASPDWYKLTIIAFLVINPILFFFVSPFLAGWLLVAEFIFTLAMALKCYPLQPGGLLAFEAIAIGMTNAEHVKAEIVANFEVVLLLIFMVAGIYLESIAWPFQVWCWHWPRCVLLQNTLESIGSPTYFISICICSIER